MSAGEPGVRDGAPLLAPQMRHADFGMRDAFRARGRSIAAAIGSRLDRNRRELRCRPKRLRRKHRLGKVEPEELVGTLLIRDSQPAPRRERRAKDGDENVFRDHSRPPETLKKATSLI